MPAEGGPNSGRRKLNFSIGAVQKYFKKWANKKCGRRESGCGKIFSLTSGFAFSSECFLLLPDLLFLVLNLLEAVELLPLQLICSTNSVVQCRKQGWESGSGNGNGFWPPGSGFISQRYGSGSFPFLINVLSRLK
jgi:hypothetical protein